MIFNTHMAMPFKNIVFLDVELLLDLMAMESIIIALLIGQVRLSSRSCGR